MSELLKPTEPEQAEQAGPAASEAYATMYEALVAESPLGMFVFDSAGTITHGNERMAKLVGLGVGELVGFSLRALPDPRLPALVEKVLSGERVRYEGDYQPARLGTKPIWVSLHVDPLRTRAGGIEGGIAYFDDRTEKTLAERALRDSEERHALHLKANPLAIILWDPDFRVLEWNASASAIFGYSEGEAIGMCGAALVPEDERAYVRAIWGDLLERAGGERATTRNSTKDGRIISCEWYNRPLVGADGKVLGVLSIVADVTERVAGEEALKRSEARFRTLIEKCPDAIVVIRGGRFVYLNRAFAEYMRLPEPHALEGEPVERFIHPDDHPLLAARRELIAGSAPLDPVEYRLVKANGEAALAEFVSMRIEFDGAPALLAIIRDLTERKLMQARLLQADRMASVGTLAAGVAHEINNPLAYLKANLDLLGRRLPRMRARLAEIAEERGHETETEAETFDHEWTEIETMLSLAREGAERMRIIVGDLRTFSRSDEAHSPVDVNRVIDAAVNLAWNEIRERARLVRDFAELPHVWANESRLGQVFLNLMVNAAQAIAPGNAEDHVITIATRVVSEERIEVSVSDSGAGITPETMERIFDPFFTTKPVGVGTGLGLWICQGIVSSLQGDIRVESDVGRGTRVTVELPIGGPALAGPEMGRAAIPAA